MSQVRPTKPQYLATMFRLLIRFGLLAYMNVLAVKLLFDHWTDPSLAGFIGFVSLSAYMFWTQSRQLGRAIQKSRLEPVDFVEITWRWDIERARRVTWSKAQRIRAWSYVVLTGLGIFAAQLDLHWELPEPFLLIPYFLIAVSLAEILKEVSYDEKKVQQLD